MSFIEIIRADRIQARSSRAAATLPERRRVHAWPLARAVLSALILITGCAKAPPQVNVGELVREHVPAAENIIGAQLAVPTRTADLGLMLPEWVQNSRPTTLWTTSTGKSQESSKLAAFEVMRVLDAMEGRLFVSCEACDEGGWVDILAVQPADAPAPWLQNHRVTRAFPGPTNETPAGPVIPQFTSLRQAGEPKAERIPVQIDPRERSAPTVWVEAGAVGPAGPPNRIIYTGGEPDGPFQMRKPMSRDAFLEAVGKAARESMISSSVPASVTVAQAILESDWGESALARLGNNYFGIKATGKIGNGGVIWFRTWEVIDGQDVYPREPFRAYRSLEDSVDDHARLFTGLRLYSAAMKVAADPLEFARAIHRAGYSTDPGYVGKLSRLMDQYDLGRLDSGNS